MYLGDVFILDEMRLYCPMTFDGWTCWNATRAGELAFHTCPPFVVGFDPSRK